MKISNGQIPPDFKITDLTGKTVQLSAYKGQKVHLTFNRFAGCPFCNLRFHEIEQLADVYRKNNVALLSVYESSPENLRDMVAGEKFYATIIPNPDSSLYKLYDLDRSMIGLFKYLFLKGGLARVMKGKKLFKQKVKEDGHIDRTDAEFLIGTDGKVLEAHYGKTPGDNLPVATIRNFITRP